jgi:hypothetical protein
VASSLGGIEWQGIKMGAGEVIKPKQTIDGITYHYDMMQGSEEWFAARCGILTASEMKLIITPTLKSASNDKERAHVYELAAQRVTQYVEPKYIGDDMLRGQDDEIDARALYVKHYAPVEEVGFITNDRHGFTIGYSPDGLVGDDGLTECKSRRQRYQLQTAVEAGDTGAIPIEYMIQVQTGLLVTQRQWCDFISYSAGMHMQTYRVYPDQKFQDAILIAATEFENRVCDKGLTYNMSINAPGARMIPTERKIIQEMY